MEVTQLATYGTILVIAAVVLGVGAMVLSDIRDDQLETSPVTNETCTLRSDSACQLNASIHNNLTVSVTQNTSAAVEYVGNWTVNAGAGTLVGIIGSPYNSTAVNVSYSFELYTSAWNSSTQGLRGINTMATWQNTIALVLAAAIVVGILLTAFQVKRK